MLLFLKLILRIMVAAVFFNCVHTHRGRTDETSYHGPSKGIEKTDRPIIGVLTQETDRNITQFGRQYVAATYIKFIESSGGRVVPILINSTSKQIEKLFKSLNGALFPGGHKLLQLTNYTRVGKQIYSLALEAYDRGDVFPIWGECLGLELISMFVSERDLSRGQENLDFFTVVDAKNISLTLSLPKDFKNNTMWRSAPSKIVKYLTKNQAAFNNHVKAITPKTFENDKKLKTFFRIASTSKDRKGLEFISTLEGKKYPVYLFHWHPAKSQFEWRTDLDILHTMDNVLVGQYFANFFLRQARKSGHKFPSKREERAALIFNYKPLEVEDYLPVVQAYFF